VSQQDQDHWDYPNRAFGGTEKTKVTSTAVQFDVDRAMWDPEKPHLMWVLVKSNIDADGEYVARIWWTKDGSNPQDFRNRLRQLATLDVREMDDAPDNVPTTTIITGLRANRQAFGLPWDATLQGITKDDELLLYVEFCQELEEGPEE